MSTALFALGDAVGAQRSDGGRRRRGEPGETLDGQRIENAQQKADGTWPAFEDLAPKTGSKPAVSAVAAAWVSGGLLGVKGSQVQILSSRPAFSQVGGRFRRNAEAAFSAFWGPVRAG